ncbi:hypothetical protein [Paenisporosarcina antarctica]|uniref:Lipoprotein n=1 Tax=Paenisporosarcina antarctica TaxID=417367 RepID=A0A4P7A0F9_9BACL|nr:hypothetical protein [Paenisporosarcina antarctica]QBP42074.1 hypothetical protein E2636_13365 [Paenisporosarcina antarctica]
MWKKTMVVLGLSALVLSGCNMRDDVPGVNETPMEDYREETRDVVPGTDERTNLPDETRDIDGNEGMNDRGTEPIAPGDEMR